MKRTLVLSLIVCAAVIGLCGCASDKGAQTTAQPKKSEKEKDTRGMQDRLKVGMRQEEVREACGNPNGKSMDSAGLESWTYSDRAKAFIPYYSISGGKFHSVVVSFDKDGKVKSWSSNESSAY
jgi:outer membrane protein assembly factor BamE (lipoprotein component of BamABCDE complex)